MNEKLQYASMLEIPVNTCNITYKPIKRKKRRKAKVSSEEVKKELLEKVNSISDTQTESEQVESTANIQTQPIERESAVAPKKQSLKERIFNRRTADGKKTFNISAVTVELIIVGVLLAVIFLTTAFYPNSAINSFMGSVFGTKQVDSTILDERVYSEFTPVLAFDQQGAVIEGGVMTVSASGSVYSTCDGTVTAVTSDDDGKYTLEITHSENFKSVLMGLDYAYAETGDAVFGNIPVGYITDGELKMCFTGENGEIITDYTISDNTVVWAV